MPIELKLPALSPTMERGTLARWLVGVGDAVKSGDLIAEIETDKATMEIEAVDEGTVASIVVAEGTDDIAVGTVIATLSKACDPATRAPPASLAAAPRAETPVTLLNATPADAVARVAPVASTRFTVDDTTNATPLARRVAAAQGIALASITGSGAGGRIIMADLGIVPRVVAAVATVAVPAAKACEAPAGIPHTVVKLSGMGRTIARRLTKSKQTVPHFYLTIHCNIDAMLVLRNGLNDSLSPRGVRLSVNDLVIKAMALAMLREPDVNVQFADDNMYRFDRVDIAMAVAINGGLVTPVIRDAANLALSAIAALSKQLAGRAREGKLTPEDYQGGTASISNLGMYGIDEMIPVINPPQALILGIGAGIEKPWMVDGGIAPATLMTATASFDHRAIDGAAAARFMAAFRDLIDQPMQLVC